ncbi:MAG: hypothetical protein HY650_00685 [Acidobacteria bacterium]|nr:hypothetical protein [Acidobacteriota bacterium]
MLWVRKAALAAAAFVFLSLEVVAQCPMCKAALTHSVEGGYSAGPFNRGILFLLFIPFLLVGLIAYRFFGVAWQRRRRGQGRSV